MRRRFHQLPGVLVAILMLAAMLPTPATLVAASPPAFAGQVDGPSYQSPQFGYAVEWSSDWAARENDTVSEPGGIDRIVLSNNDGLVQVIGEETGPTPAEYLETTVEDLLGDSAEIIASDLEADVPSVEATSGSQNYLLQAYDVGDSNVVVILRARENDFQGALTLAQEGITLNGTPVLTSEPVDPSTAPDPTEEPNEEEAGESGIDGRTFTSLSYGWEVSWGALWQASEIIEPGFEILQLSSLSGTLSIIAGELYGGDPEDCFASEVAYYTSGDESISGFSPAVDEDGETIEFSDDSVAWGIFTLVYHGEQGDVDLVEYLECRTLEAGETDLIVLTTATPDQFNRHLESSLSITNNIEMPRGSELSEPIDPPLPDFDAQTEPDASGEPDATEEPEATEEPDRPEGDSSLDGDTFTSPGFGFTLEIPDGWIVEDEVIADGDEQLVLNNGISTVTVRAIESDEENLTRCIGMIEAETEDDPRYADLSISTTSSGDPFQGADDRGAYALYTYTGEDGEPWAYYVFCQFIDEGESILVVIQDVPYNDYATQRLARRQIQDAIELP